MSVEELDELLPLAMRAEVGNAWLSTHMWLSYHGSIQAVKLVTESNMSAPPRVQHHAHHDYQVLQG